VAKVDAVQGQTTINQKVVAIAAEMWQWQRQWQRYGDGGNGVDKTAAMAAVTAAPTWRRQWQRGRPMWAEVIFSLTVICITVGYVWYRCDNNC
jgi:hypothetical protein